MILVKTPRGQQVMRDRSVALSPRQRQAFILFDGRRSLDEVLAMASGIPRDEIDALLAGGLLAPVPGVATPATAVEPDGDEPPAARFQQAYRLASKLTGSLGLRGFRLNLAVEGAADLDALRMLYPRIEAALGPQKTDALRQSLGLPG